MFCTCFQLSSTIEIINSAKTVTALPFISSLNSASNDFLRHLTCINSLVLHVSDRTGFMHAGVVGYINPSHTTSSSPVALVATSAFHTMHFFKATLTLLYVACVSATSIPARADEGSAVDQPMEARQLTGPIPCILSFPIPVSDSTCSIHYCN